MNFLEITYIIDEFLSQLSVQFL